MLTIPLSDCRVQRLTPDHIGSVFVTSEPDGANLRVVIGGGGMINAHLALSLAGANPLVAHRLQGNPFSGIHIDTPNLRIRLPDTPLIAREHFAKGVLAVDARSCKLVIAWAPGMGSNEGALLDLSDWTMQQDYRLDEPTFFLGEWELIFGPDDRPQTLVRFSARAD